ncbi:hypothetical protein Syun_026574 [Stephania yunnanensis]|uniref:Uncharacterized protein n=1 Tax=Stephania yunnanensis TaxID=152371 RepID=A0AAP0EU78_9MAGN
MYERGPHRSMAPQCGYCQWNWLGEVDSSPCVDSSIDPFPQRIILHKLPQLHMRISSSLSHACQPNIQVPLCLKKGATLETFGLQGARKPSEEFVAADLTFVLEKDLD